MTMADGGAGGSGGAHCAPSLRPAAWRPVAAGGCAQEGMLALVQDAAERSRDDGVEADLMFGVYSRARR